jgi:hypothetical protein
MTSLGVVNANNASSNGWVELFVLSVTPGAGAKTVVATVTSGSVAFTNLKASSVSYGNVTSAVLGSVTYGNSNSPQATTLSTNYGGIAVGAMFSNGSTFSSYPTGVTSRFVNNTAPSLSIADSSFAAGYGFQTAATLAASSAWAAVVVSLNTNTIGNGGGGGANAGTTEQGSSPGNLTFNSQTYTGGAAAGTNNNSSTIAGNAPGGGGAGTNGVFLGSGPAGGAGGTGRVWIYAYQ